MTLAWKDLALVMVGGAAGAAAGIALGRAIA